MKFLPSQHPFWSRLSRKHLHSPHRAGDRPLGLTTWKTHFETLKDHHFHSLGMASDRGLGLVAGYRDASLKLSGWQTTFMSFKAASMYVSIGEKKT